MGSTYVFRLLETAVVGFIGGYLFSIIHFPLPWMLGSLTLVMVWQGLMKRKSYWPGSIKNSGLIILGIYFGLYFSKETFLTVGPYFLPYLIATFLLILFSIFLSSIVTRWINVDNITSAFGSIPGGLTEMVIASEALNAKSSFVLIFQTVRLLTVLFLVPSTITYIFNERSSSSYEWSTATVFSFGNWNLLWFVIPVVMGILFRNKLPAGTVIVPLLITALMNISIISLSTLPPFLLILAQVAVGIGLGKNISFSDLRLGGKYCFVYFGVSLALIFVSFGLGGLLAHFTTLNLSTAILSIAPGGLIEMVLTASIIGGDPAIVSALQLTRILVIVIFVPSFIKWYFKKAEIQNAA
ncbi:hypothetical protein BKP45_13830 [Anaerobacillus alkalidiazotrophicus]|uniref:AbrB family transcriptional regulator n=1 Tax=Anaerobacillus alkalidiazotrophicus TaxID=472963 RepID=A0A1S2M440_9BACI|nr:AbrB family transcriptional regulator [Anaerobacillus alkalidiazotrophicus]OIJ19233.1 hypothetical protein BKP45_13830 [Anaerobacillus alkalidiazotrophicus]